MKMFGLTESVRASIPWWGPIQIDHRDLFKKLSEYGSKPSVGLELLNAKKKYEISPVTFTNQEIHMDLLSYFRENGNVVYFLESMENCKEVAQFAKQMQKLSKWIRKTGDVNEQVRLEDKKTNVSIESAYCQLFGKEKAILQNIAKYRPDIVLLGAGHSGRFFRDREAIKRDYGIEIDEYWEDDLASDITQNDSMMAMRCSSEHVPAEEYLHNKAVAKLKRIESPEDALDDKICDHIERMYKSLKEGRVTDGEPHFIGTWTPRPSYILPHLGRFEVYVNDAHASNGRIEMRGVIEDSMGTAVFEGSKSDTDIDFTKNYTTVFVDRQVCTNIRYSANYDASRGVFVGNYHAPENSGPFEMKPKKPITVAPGDFGGEIPF